MAGVRKRKSLRVQRGAVKNRVRKELKSGERTVEPEKGSSGAGGKATGFEDPAAGLVIANHTRYHVDLSKLRIREAHVTLKFPFGNHYVVNLEVPHVHEDRLASVGTPIGNAELHFDPIRTIYEAVCRAVLHEVDETLSINGKRVVPGHNIDGDTRANVSVFGDPRHDDKEQFWLPRYYNKTNVWKLL